MFGGSNAFTGPGVILHGFDVLLWNTASFPRRGGLFLAWVVNIVIILTIYNTAGYTRLLGLSHIIAWTPLLPYLLSQRRPFTEENWAGRYLYWFMAVITVSLIFDYIDVVRYFLGDTTW